MVKSISIFLIIISSHFLIISSEDLVRSSCIHTEYPNLCLRTLSSYSYLAKTPTDLAQAAVNVTISGARSASDYLATRKTSGTREREALVYCINQISNSITQLSKSLTELKHLRRASLRYQLFNVNLWVSGALRYEDMCLDLPKEVNVTVKADVMNKISNVYKLTSNALDLITMIHQNPRSP